MKVPTKERKTNRRRREKCWTEDLWLARAEGSSAHIKRRALDRNSDSHARMQEKAEAAGE